MCQLCCWKVVLIYYCSIYFQVVISVITLFSLFMEDIRIIFFDKSYDEEIDAVHLASIAIFMV